MYLSFGDGAAVDSAAGFGGDRCDDGLDNSGDDTSATGDGSSSKGLVETATATAAGVDERRRQKPAAAAAARTAARQVHAAAPVAVEAASGIGRE